MSPVVIVTLLKLSLVCPALLAPPERKALLDYARTGDRVPCEASARRVNEIMQTRLRIERSVFSSMRNLAKQAEFVARERPLNRNIALEKVEFSRRGMIHLVHKHLRDMVQQASFHMAYWTIHVARQVVTMGLPDRARPSH